MYYVAFHPKDQNLGSPGTAFSTQTFLTRDDAIQHAKTRITSASYNRNLTYEILQRHAKVEMNTVNVEYF